MKYSKRDHKEIADAIELNEKEQEIVDLYDEDEIEEFTDDKKIRRAKLIINIIFSIIVILIVMVAVDIICVSRYSKGPFFAIPVHTYKDGGSKEYYGLGYKVIKYNQKQGRRDMELGNWSLKYNIEPITIKDVDMAIEFNDDSEKAYAKYYKKFVRIISTLKKVDKKNRTITIGYFDEGDKYTLEIECDINKDEDQAIIDKFKEGKEITIIGTVKELELNKTNKLHISDCFAEQ